MQYNSSRRRSVHHHDLAALHYKVVVAYVLVQRSIQKNGFAANIVDVFVWIVFIASIQMD